MIKLLFFNTNSYTNQLFIYRAIVNHFTPKVDAWSAAKQLSSLTEEQVCYYSGLTTFVHSLMEWPNILTS